jgi:hypothetical protein
MYQQYLILFTEITRNKKTQLHLQDEEISIQSPKDNVWIITLPLLCFEEKIPSKVADCIFSCSLQFFQSTGPKVQIEGKKIVLRLVAKAPESFTGFKQMINGLCYQAKEWRETLRGLSRQSPSKNFIDALFFAH